jgi:hypothetical protein
MKFLFQVDLASMARFDIEERLPRTGLLLLFQQPGDLVCRLVLVPEGTALPPYNLSMGSISLASASLTALACASAPSPKLQWGSGVTASSLLLEPNLLLGMKPGKRARAASRFVHRLAPSRQSAMS